MKKYLLYCVILLSMFGNNTYSQSYSKLHVGDMIPEIPFKEVKNFNGKSATISAFSGKYLIIDFWDKFCSSCISSFPKIQKIQAEFSNYLEIILVSKNKQQEVENLFKNSPVLKKITLPFVFQDTLLSNSLFPHKVVPHYVWVNPSGRVVAITDYLAISEENIQKFIKGLDLSHIPSADKTYPSTDLSKSENSLLTINNGVFRQNLCYYYVDPGRKESDSAFEREKPYSLFTYRIDGVENINTNKLEFVKDKKQKKTGVMLLNYPLDFLINYAYSYYKDLNKNWSGKVLISRDLPISSPIENIQQWRFDNTYCYETQRKEFDVDKIPELLKSDLERYLGVNGKIEKRMLKCWVLSISSPNRIVYAKKNIEMPVFEFINNKTIISDVFFGEFIQRLQLANSYFDPMAPVIVDRTGIPSNTRIEMILPTQNFKDLEHLKIGLSKYGISITEELISLYVLVLEKNIFTLN